MWVCGGVKMCFDVQQLTCSQSEVNADAPKRVNKQKRDYCQSWPCCSIVFRREFWRLLFLFQLTFTFPSGAGPQHCHPPLRHVCPPPAPHFFFRLFLVRLDNKGFTNTMDNGVVTRIYTYAGEEMQWAWKWRGSEEGGALMQATLYVVLNHRRFKPFVSSLCSISYLLDNIKWGF